MARTKRPNYALNEVVPTEVPTAVERRETRSRIVYEDPDSSEDNIADGNDGDGDDGDSRTVTDDESEGIQPMLPMEMYFQPREYVQKIKISTRCYITPAVELLLSGLKYPLREEERSWFLHHPQFKHFFHMHKDRNHKVMGMWLLLLRTAVTEKTKEAWFIVNGVPIRYGLREHALISGLSCRSYPPNHEELGSMVFVEKYFGAGSKIRYYDVKEQLMKMRYSPERLKMAILFFLSSVIIGQSKVGEDATCVDRFFQRAVSDLHLCKTFPWGRLSFDNNMQEIQHTVDHFKGVVTGTNWAYPSFCIPLELLAFEAIPSLRKKFREAVPSAKKVCPRMCKTKFKKSAMKGFSLEEINEALGTTKEIDSILVPYNEEEAMLARITEEDDDDDVDDVVVGSWLKCILEEYKPVCFEQMYAEDVAARLEEQPVNEANAATNVVTGSEENASLTELVGVVKKIKSEMEKGFKKVNEKLAGLDTRMVAVEGYVKEQLDARREYEDVGYGAFSPHDDGLEKEQGSKDKEKDNGLVEETTTLDVEKGGEEGLQVAGEKGGEEGLQGAGEKGGEEGLQGAGEKGGEEGLQGAGEKGGDEGIEGNEEEAQSEKDREDNVPVDEETTALDGEKGGEEQLHGAGEKGGDDQEKEGEVHGADEVVEDVSMMEEGEEAEEDVTQISIERCSTVVVRDGQRLKDIKGKPETKQTYGRRKTRSQVHGIEEGGEPSKRTKKRSQNLMPPFTEEKGRGKRPRKN